MISLILIFIFITGVLLIYYFSSLGHEYSPTGKIYAILKKKNMTYKEIIDCFPRDLISTRIEHFRKIGLLQYKNEKLYVTGVGKLIVYIFGAYRRILGWR